MLLRDHSDALLRGAIAIDDAHPMTPRWVAEQVASGCYFAASFANVTAFDAGGELVLVDTGSFVLADQTRALLRGVARGPATTAIWTHGHVDHCFGVDGYEREHGRAMHVIAHEAVARRFERYRLTRGYNHTINARQFQREVAFPDAFRAPDETYRERLTVERGGRRFELHHALGETDDATWVWVPDAGVVCAGDLFIWAAPNCGNPQKVQRYPREWAAALRAMDELGAEVLCPGHGVPIFGAAAVHRALDETASYLEALVEQVVALLNDGARVDRIIAEVRPPSGLAGRPSLAPIYDEPEFIVRNLCRLYGGWWDGNPAHLKPPREAELAHEVAQLSGGSARLAQRARALARDNMRLACELIELAASAAPDDAAIAVARRELYAARAASERSLMARGIFTAASKA
jgi:glyoxylase-like metal-dependent hydrolase (beta-lactamase superfamily II)